MSKIKNVVIDILNEQRDIETENMYKLKWNNGNGTCTFGDMDIKRHKNTLCINEFPCGMRCTACGTFWID